LQTLPQSGLTRSFRLEISYDFILQAATDASFSSILDGNRSKVREFSEKV
jgi:hypothetical protein